MIQFTRVICLLCVLSVLSVVYGFVAPGRTRTGPNFCRGVCTKLPELHMVAVVPFAIPVALPGAVGEIASKINISSIQAKRIFNLSALTAVFIAFRSKISSAFTNGSKNMESGWKKRGDGSAAQRTIEVYTFAISFAFKFLSAQKYKKKDPVKYEEIQKVLAVTLRDKILALGPTFIKLGQLLSTRIDVLPKTYIDALAVLQDKVPGFSGDMAVQIIEEQFGKPIGDLYDTFDTTSLAAASLGQVHLATKNGKTLAVKIQRQGLKTLFDQDLKNIKVLAQLLDKFDPKSDGAARDWTTIYDESARLLYREINYKYECENGMRFGDNFKNVPWVKIPEFYPELTSEQVVTMEYVPGIKINDIEKIEAAGIDRELLSKRSAEAYLTQVCRHGFFHCDPHPGNVACDAEEGGRLIFYDFGMMDELKPEVKKGLVDLIFSIFENDYKEACNSLEEIGCLKKGVDRVSIEKIARIFLSEFKDGAKVGGKWVNQLPKEQQREIRRQRRAQLGSDLFSVGSDVPFKFPPTFTFVFRAFTSLDGIGKGLDAKYDLTRLAQPFLKELVDLRDGSATVSFLKTWGKKTGLRPVDIGHLVQSPRKVANLESIVTRMEQGDLKIRVRDLKTEQSFRRLELVQQNMALGIAASAALNVGLILSAATPAGQMTRAAQAGLAVAGVLGTQVAVGVAKVAALDKKLKSFEST